ncbi:putative inactive cadmium/zinc-transporting ATPase HMA3 [Apium graveolens]|uniref:putative inactive cadmium/zinc-transporting ATPase HMA3 n=1 Tax=Apium graveolens TaxID=4045 RepID=UPI003D791CCF
MDNDKVEKSYLYVSGICCNSEIPLIEKLLKQLEGVVEVTVIVPSKTVIVLHHSLHISQLQIVNALNKSGLEASVKDKAGGGESNKKKNKNKKRWPSPFVVGSGLMVVLTFILQHIYHPLRYLGLAAVALAIFPIFFKAVAALRNCNLTNINILVLITVAGSIVLKDYLEAGTIVFLFTFAQWLESKASHRATSAMSSLANIVPQTAVIAETGERVNADQVQLNTILSIKPGDVIPIDGVVVQGNCDVDEKTLTGESFPVSKQIDSTVWAGTINLNGYLSVKTTALAEDSVVARMANLVEEAQKNKSKTQRIVDKCTKYYTPLIIAIALCLVIVPSAIRAHDLSEWYRLALVVLVSACPCALVLSTPVAAFCALSNAAKSGLLVKGAEHLETLAKVKIMAFDKTGTITTGEFVVADFKPLLQDDNITLHKLLYWVASIESKSSHPMAEALVEYAKSNSVEPKPDDVEEFHNFPGEGICGKIDGKDIYVGNKRIAIRAGCATLPIIGDDEMEGKSIGYIFSGSSLAGIFSLSDVCRTGVKEAIQELKSMGIKSAMLTGDHQAAAKHAQDQIGGALELVHAELLPEDKARIIKDFQHESATAMIGDGLNDAAALATADIGISMGISGSALAMETGNIILMSNDIRKIPQAVRLARKTKVKILENIFLSIITKTAIVVLAIMGHPLVWAAVLADAGTCLLVICNSMLLLAHEDNHGKGCFKSSIFAHKRRNAHSHKHCCSSTKPVKKHVHKRCSSQSHSKAVSSVSCGINRKTSLAKDQGCCKLDAHQTRGVQHNVAISESKSPCHQHCCSANQVETKCIPHLNSPKHQCGSMSPKSCGEIKPLSKSAETDGCCEYDDRLEKVEHVKHVNHGCCEQGDKYEEETQTNHGICDIVHSHEEEKCIDSVARGHGCCSTNHSEHEPKPCKTIKHTSHCHHQESSTISHERLDDDHRPISSPGADRHTNEHAKDYVTEDELKSIVNSCCGHHSTDEAGCTSASSVSYPSIKVKHVRGCCKTFRKECCGQEGVLGVVRLSEIVIE